MTNLPEIRPDDLPTARWLDALRKLVMRPVRGLAPLVVRVTADEVVISIDLPQEADFRVLSGSNPYAGEEVVAATAGAWNTLANGRTPTLAVDPLWEKNDNNGVLAGTVVRATRARATAEWVFDRGTCSAASPSAPTTPSTPSSPAPNPPANPSPGPGPTDPGPPPTPDPAPTPTKPKPPDVPAYPGPDAPPAYPEPTYPAPNFPGPIPTEGGPTERYPTVPTPSYPAPGGDYPGPVAPTGTTVPGSGGRRRESTPEDP